jgi:hypothetical protein
LVISSVHIHTYLPTYLLCAHIDVLLRNPPKLTDAQHILPKHQLSRTQRCVCCAHHELMAVLSALSEKWHSVRGCHGPGHEASEAVQIAHAPLGLAVIQIELHAAWHPDGTWPVSRPRPTRFTWRGIKQT